MKTLDCCIDAHPLVRVERLKEACAMADDCYSIVVAERSARRLLGCQTCDYRDGMVAFFAPGCRQPVPSGAVVALSFHPCFVECTSLGCHFGDFSFFSYRQSESLFVSCKEKTVVMDAIGGIAEELKWGVDEFTNTLLAEKIELLLNYCRRYYHRQFLTRSDRNCRIVCKIKCAVDEGIRKNPGLPVTSPLPCFSEKLGMSEAYLLDMFRHETGKTLAEYARLRRYELVGKPELAAAEASARYS